ncbi:MAG TPA: phenylalanine--tRNA ligase subunit beta [Terriglobia bacterium]|nr:phenylalanine--tRNA ligase subunit beta [Terriglobia bacterium]
MKISLNWLRDFIDVPAGPLEIKRTLTQVGLGVESVVGFDEDAILEVEVTTNRPDCLNHYGIAREISAVYRVPLKKIEVVLKEYGPPIAEDISIEIREPDLCARYCGRVIRNLQVRPSPDWLVSRLVRVGARPINSVTDVTNYVLLELGHPMHAFDLAELRQRKLVVRRAQAGERLRTLDGVERLLTRDNLLIADGERPVALAGVMGGEESGIKAETTSVLLESAWFDPLSIRRTAKAQGMHTEASHRFERGADIEMAPLALDRATELILALAGGEISRGRIDAYPRPLRRDKIDLRRSEIRRILGGEVVWEDVERALRSLGFSVERRGTEGWRVIPPSFRLDVSREVDLIEEVARQFGYDRLPSRLVPAPPRVENDLVRQKEVAVAQVLVGLGYREIKTSPMVDTAENARFSARTPVALQNPLSQEASALRTSAMPTMLAAVRWNLDREQEDLRFFEIGKTYWTSTDGPKERRALALGLTGHRQPETIHERPREANFFDLKGDLETILGVFQTGRLKFSMLAEATHSNPAGNAPANDRQSLGLCGIRGFAAGLSGKFLCDEMTVVVFGKIDESLTEECRLRRPAWLAEIDLECLLEFPLKPKAFRAFSKFPAVQRDFSLLVPDRVNYDQISASVESLSAPEIVRFQPLDRFRGETVDSGHYALLLRILFQSEEHTLTGEEINAASEKVLQALGPLGVRLRR